MKDVVKLIKFLYWDKPIYNKKSRINFKFLDDFQTNVLKAVEEKGFYIADSFFDKEVVDKMKVDALDFESLATDSKNHLSFPDFGVDRFLKADARDCLAPFFCGYFDTIGKYYLGGHGVRFQSMFERKGGLDKLSSADVSHFDDWRKRFKIFLYLNDVNDKNCPFVIYENSLGSYNGRRFKEIEYVLGGKSSAYGHLCPNEERQLISETNVSKVSLTANSGTVIFVDTRFVHKGTPSVDGSQRLMLGSYYDIR
tara:strand:+ start:207 stop:965 length:759 start_codon:yes stop_codon:yes gene_type:complete